MKRGLDFILAATGIVVSAPLWVLFAIAVKLEDGGPIFYRQVRVGRNARAFAVLKFRTLHPDAEVQGVTADDCIEGIFRETPAPRVQ